MSRRSFPITLGVFLLAIAVVDAFANEYSLYWTVRWFDMPMHFAGGAWVSGVTLWRKFFYHRVASDTTPSFWNLLQWALLGALVIGLGWEVYESIVSLFTVGHINDILDTVSDLAFDLLGGLVVACTALFFIKAPSRNI